MRFAIYLTEKFPFLAYFMFGRRKSHVNIYKFHDDWSYTHAYLDFEHKMGTHEREKEGR